MGQKCYRHLKIIREERGQTIILVALAMFVLLGFLALAIDVGMAYAERRTMQNAADAAASAGTRVITLRSSTTDDTDVKQAIDMYAELNGGPIDYSDSPPYYIAGDGSVISRVGIGGNIPSGARGVSLAAKTTLNTFFATLLGHPVVDVAAQCAAAAFQAEMPNAGGSPPPGTDSSSCPECLAGLVPLTVPKSAVEARDPLIVWGSQYGHHYGVGANFKGILDFNTGMGPGYQPGVPCGNKKDCVVQWITYGFDGRIAAYNWITEFNGELGNNVRSPLQKRLYNQHLSDSGGDYGYIIVPVWDDEEFGVFHIDSFVCVKMYAADVDSNEARGEYVAFVAPDATISADAWDPIGPKVIKLVKPTN